MSGHDLGLVLIIILALGGAGWSWRAAPFRDFGGWGAILIILIAVLMLLHRVFV